MKPLLFITSLLLCFLSFGQTIGKPTYYADVNGYLISNKLFKEKASMDKPINERYFSIVFENDTCNIKKLVKRKNYGRLTSTKKEALLSNLNTNSTNSKERYVVILYFPGTDKCNGGVASYNGSKNHIYNSRYIKRSLKKYDHKLFWVHKYDPTINFKTIRSVDWQPDEKQMVEKQFFKHNYPCNSFVVIDTENGNYISLLGESGASSVIDIVKEMGAP